jgi:hypothetical protein
MTWLFKIEEFDDSLFAAVVSEEYWNENGYLNLQVSGSDIREDHPEFKFPEVTEAHFEISYYTKQEARMHLKSMGMEELPEDAFE